MNTMNKFHIIYIRNQQEYYIALVHVLQGTAVAQWLRCCATNLKVTGSIPNGVIGIFH